MPHMARYAHAAIDGQVHFGTGSPYGWRRPTDEEWAKHDAAEAAFLHVVNGVDWDRVLIEAIGRHLLLDHPNDRLPTRWISHDFGGDDAPGVCGECIFACLIARATNSGGWEEKPWGDPVVAGDITHPGYRPAFDAAVAADKATERQRDEV